LVAVFAAVAIALLSRLSTSKALTQFLKNDVGGVHEKQLRDLTEAHRRHIAGMKHESSREILRLRSDVNNAALKFDRLYNEHDYISSMYQEQVRHTQEQEDRIEYLEKKLQEFGQSTPISRVPFSAPPSQITFSNPPRRERPNEVFHSIPLASPLAQVAEDQDE
jgi:TolA-binding protein